MTIGLEKMIVLRQHVYDLLGRVQKVDAVKHSRTKNIRSK
jgi:hypothetical protein